MKTLITIDINSQASFLFQLTIDGNVVLTVSHPYQKTLEILVDADIKQHIMSWYIKGNEGEEYSIQVTKPVALPVETAALGEDGIEIGYIKF